MKNKYKLIYSKEERKEFIKLFKRKKKEKFDLEKTKKEYN